MSPPKSGSTGPDSGDPNSSEFREKEYYITWDDIPEAPQQELAIEPTLLLPPLHTFDDYIGMKTWANKSYRLETRNLEVKRITFWLDNGPDAFQNAEPLELWWASLGRYIREERDLRFQFTAMETIWTGKYQDKENKATIKRRIVYKSKADALEEKRNAIPLFEQKVFAMADEIARFIENEESDGSTGSEGRMDIAEIPSGTDPDATLDEVSDEEEDTGPDRSSASESEGDDWKECAATIRHETDDSDYKPPESEPSDGSGEDETYGWPTTAVSAATVEERNVPLVTLLPSIENIPRLRERMPTMIAEDQGYLADSEMEL